MNKTVLTILIALALAAIYWDKIREVVESVKESFPPDDPEDSLLDSHRSPGDYGYRSGYGRPTGYRGTGE